MAKYKRVQGGEKNKLSGVPFTKPELEKVADLYIEIDGKGIHENNPKIHRLSEEMGRTIRSIENQLLGFRSVDSKETGRANYNRLIKSIWDERSKDRAKKQIEIDAYRTQRKEQRLQNDDFKFKISSQLKNIIGKELITDDYIAVFELVKNSFDAHAKHVKIIFDNDKITVWDDGKGMDKEDILNKWLFVAYSAKKDGTEDLEFEDHKSYRDKISPKKNFAGAKGIGRFSSDRLGASLNLTTKKITDNSAYWQLNFNWDDFENDAEDEFIDIEIEHSSSADTKFQNFHHGVILEITNLRSVWSRDKILRLKWSLEKLINPFENVDKRDGNSTFSIEIISEKDQELDEKIKNELKNPSKTKHTLRDIVNGNVQNFIFNTLGIKTTQITVTVKEDKLITRLIDRGNLIYEIEESFIDDELKKQRNLYHYIPLNSTIQLFYLNQAAKINFTRLMGVDAVNFGSIFLFNNGFRVFPIGEPGDDSFGIDRRKGQGYARNIGLRELIGSIELWGVSEYFQEASSRDGGLIETPGTKQIDSLLIETLKKLERYVQPILWQIKKRTGNEGEEIDFDAKAEIIDMIAKLAGHKNLKLLNYSKDFLNIINEKAIDTPLKVFENLRKIAEETDDENFANEIIDSELEFIQLKEERDEEERKKLEAEQKAAEERDRRIELEKKLKAEEDKRKEEEYLRLKAEEEAREERNKRIVAEQQRRQKESQVKFLESVASLDIEDVLNLHHQIGIDSNTIDALIINMKRELDKINSISNEEVRTFLEKVTFANKKILAVTKFSTRENFMAAARSVDDDIVSFLKNYLINIYKFHLGKDLDLEVVDNIKSSYILNFKPIELTMIIDNLISNSKRKNAKKVSFTFSLTKNQEFEISYRDNGDGLDKGIEKPDEIFEKGFTTTRGSGLGLFHVRKILTEQKGSIKVNPQKNGIEFIIKFSN